MDRRAALKKLAAGGAIAAGGSFVLSSNKVAFAASGSNIPPPGDPLPVVSTSTQGQVTMTDSTFYFCPDGNEADVTYAWKINDFNLRPPKNTIVELVDGVTGAPLGSASGWPRCNSSCTNAPFIGGTNSAELMRDHSKLKNGDSYDIGMMVTWVCPSNTTVHEYSITGTYPGPATSTYVG